MDHADRHFVRDTDEFPPGADEWPDGPSRREFLRLLGSSLALAGATACTRQPLEKITPYVRQPELTIPGIPNFFASAHVLAGYARGILVETHEGRPTKIEGNPDHPASLGGTDVFMQAAILDLYDPDRSQAILRDGQPASWGGFGQDLAAALAPLAEKRGAGLYVLTEAVTSPTLLGQFARLRERFPEMRWEQLEPLHRGAAREGARRAFGEALDAIHDFEKADVVIALDADFLSTGPASLRSTRAWADRRRAALSGNPMGRLYVAEPCPTITGAMADARLRCRSGDVAELARQLYTVIAAGDIAQASAWARQAAREAQEAKGRSIVLAGENQPPEVHELVCRINALLGNIGATIFYIEPLDQAAAQPEKRLAELADDMRAGKVSALLVLGGNPARLAPAEVDLPAAMEKAPWRAHLGLYADETAALCRWHLPEAHILESWSDARSFDGTASIIQPLIEPLHGGRSVHEVLELMLEGIAAPFEIVRNHWAKQDLADPAWRAALAAGVIPQTAAPVKQPRIVSPDVTAAPATKADAAGLEANLRPDANILDGRYANNVWLQELPRVISKISWGNAVLLSPATAGRLKLVTGQLVELQAGGRTVQGPIFVMAGHADESVTLALGFGRSGIGRAAEGTGFDAGLLRGPDSPHRFPVELKPLDESLALALTQEHHRTEGRDLLRVFRAKDALEKAKTYDRAHPRPDREETLFNPGEFENQGYAWGMVIDLNTCVGCNACVIACQAENNIPVVGKEEVMRGREMQWIRIDSYFSGKEEDPEIYFQPTTCMHCENAPCELVCPVGATVTDREGLNVQVYNRCIGTRYCSNNCPYKVRRFNFLEYTGAVYESAPLRRLGRNPNVSVRTRGVMEKCTYCLQRISTARIRSEVEDRRVHDGEVTPACAQACPARAISFGDIHNAQSAVSQLKAHPFNYEMLAELNTRPRTSYLARVMDAGKEGAHA